VVWLPLSLGIAVFLAWLVTQWDWLTIAGVVVLYGGLIGVAGGFAALAHGSWIARPQRGRVRSRAADARVEMHRFTAPELSGRRGHHLERDRRRNALHRGGGQRVQEPLDDVRIVGGGCDVGFDSIPPGAAARRSFWIQREDTLRFRASRQRGQIEDVVDPYVTRSLGGHATVTVDRNGGVATAQEHRRSDPWFWLHLADCPDPRL